MNTRIIAALALGALACASQAHAQWWNPMDPRPPKVWRMDPPPKVVYTHKTVDAAHLVAGQAFWKDDFETLDRMYDELLAGQVRAEDGTSMIEPFGRFLGSVAGSPVVDDAFATWARKSPASKLRPVAEAIRWESAAWQARGGAGVASVPGETMQIFQHDLARATKALAAAEPDGKQSPLWYWVALIVAGSSQRPAAQFDALFAEAADRFPTYQPLYYTRVNYLLPQWGGDFDAVDKFVAASVKRTSAQEGDAFYAWIYVDISTSIDGDLFEVTKATWPRMKKGFEDMVARHPDPWNKNLYATWACRVRDRETTARLLTELGNDAKLGHVSSPGITTESCRRFALTGA
jgi:hypothetical protein